MESPVKRCYPVGMRNIIAALALIAALSLVAVSNPEAALGSQFADLYSSFAPLYALYRSYADHLFTGAPVAIPSGIGGSCAELFSAVNGIPSDLLTQTSSVALAVLRAEVVGFCASYRLTLEEIERSSPEGLIPLLDRASDEKLFASIHKLNSTLEGTLSQALSALGEGVKRWRFAVAFAVRTIIDRSTIDRIDDDLRGIFYGEEGGAPPVDLPEQVSDAMAALIALSGRPLTEGEADQARYLAEYIECYFVFDSLPQE